jgi:arylsulfatase A
MNKRILLALLLSAWATLPVTHAAERPNIVIFFMDDMGYSDLHIDGALDARTPNLDRFAKESVRLTDCYAAAPVCTPTRAAFMTGRYQHRVGLEGVIAPSLGNADTGLPATEPTLPRYLQNAGYVTGLIGKWHLGFRPEFRPNRHGFDEFFGFLGGAVDYYGHLGEDGKHDLYENDGPVKVDGYLTDEITRRAVSFVERNAAKSFFLDVAYNATHWPFQPPDMKTRSAHPDGTGGDVVRVWASEGTRDDYIRMLERADEGIGRILSTIDRLGLRENTLVIFTSDNGGEWLSRMEPLFHRKSTLWEGGLRVPCILRWPAKLEGKRKSSQPAITMDLTATIMAAAGVKARADKPFDGVDLIPLLKAKAVTPRTFFWRGIRAGSPDRAVREGSLKYLSYSHFPGLLFDVVADPGERKDLASTRVETLRRLDAAHRAWEREVVPAAKP